jgi:hypothetical protein
MGLYDAFRDKPFQTAYGENKTAVTVDVLEVGLILAFVLLAFSFFVVLPGFRHREVKNGAHWERGLPFTLGGGGGTLPSSGLPIEAGILLIPMKR